MGQMTEIMFEMTELEQMDQKKNMTTKKDTYVFALRFKESLKLSNTQPERRGHCYNRCQVKKYLISIKILIFCILRLICKKGLLRSLHAVGRCYPNWNMTAQCSGPVRSNLGTLSPFVWRLLRGALKT